MRSQVQYTADIAGGHGDRIDKNGRRGIESMSE
jgi:hypothetical protein